MSRLLGKVIVVTGSCTGIGAAMVTRFVEEGAKVIVHGLDKQAGEKLVATLGNKNATLLIADVTDESTPQMLIDLALTTFGKLDTVVNNAAMIASSNIESTTLAFFDKMLSTNLLAPFRLIQAALQYLRNSNGSVLNIGSVNAWSGEPDLLAYSVSKGGLQTMTRNLGDSLFRDFGVRVNQINPGWVLTQNESAKKKSEGFSENWESKLPKEFAPSGRILRPEEIAAAAVFLLSDESGPITGQVFDLEQYPMLGRNPPKNLGIF